MGLIQKKEGGKYGDIFHKVIQNRLDKNKNFIGTVVAETGAGKSYLCGSIAEDEHLRRFNEEFPAETNVIFGADSFLKRLLSKNLRKGEVLIVEEVGTVAGSRDFMSKMNKALNYVMQTFRSMNLVILLNLPYVQMLDKSLRMLAHATLEIDHVDKQESICYFKPYFNQVNPKSGKIYSKFLRVKDKTTGRVQKIKLMTYQKPSESFIKIYEPMKHQYVVDTIKKGLDSIQENMEKPIEKTGTTAQREAKRLFLEFDGDIKKIAETLGISLPSTYQRLGGKENLADLSVRLEDINKFSKKNGK